MQFADQVFKAYDIRGLVPEELTPELARAVGRALADWLPNNGPVAVGRDMRPSSAELAEALIKGLTRQGREVADLGLITSDMIYFASAHYGLAGAAIVTASHNPGQYDGIKICREKSIPVGLESGLEAIKQAVIEDRYREASNRGAVINKDAGDDWLKHALSFVDPGSWRPLRIAIDAANGMAGPVMASLRERLPIEITPLFWELDGSFPNHQPNPLEPHNLRKLVKTIKEQKLDFGIAFDGDGDRAFLVDETGELISSSLMICLLAKHYLAQEPGAIIVNNSTCSRIVPETIEKLGGKVVRTKVGMPELFAAMSEHDAIFGGEFAGHYHFRDNFYSDSGLIAALVAIEIINASRQKLSELVKPYQKYFNSGERSFPAEGSDVIMARAADRFKDGRIDRLDGLTVNYSDWWFNLRLSNTEPLLKLNVEATNRALLEQKTAELIALALDTQPRDQ